MCRFYVRESHLILKKDFRYWINKVRTRQGRWWAFCFGKKRMVQSRPSRAKPICYNCDELGHMTKWYPKLSNWSMNVFVVKYLSECDLEITLRIMIKNTRLMFLKSHISDHEIIFLVDTMAIHSFMSLVLEKELNLSTYKANKLIQVRFINGKSCQTLDVVLDIWFQS